MSLTSYAQFGNKCISKICNLSQFKIDTLTLTLKYNKAFFDGRIFIQNCPKYCKKYFNLCINI